jgi:hypothetical protein
MELCLDPIEEKDTAIAITLTFIFRFVGIILLIKVILWQIGIVVSSDPRQICLVISVGIGINIRQLGTGVGLLLLILCIEAALDV